MLEKTSLGRIRSVLYVLYVLKPAKRADFSMIGRFVNFLMLTRRTGPRPAGSLLSRTGVNHVAWFTLRSFLCPPPLLHCVLPASELETGRQPRGESYMGSSPNFQCQIRSLYRTSLYCGGVGSW